jgi:hypothetical protein
MNSREQDYRGLLSALSGGRGRVGQGRAGVRLLPGQPLSDHDRDRDRDHGPRLYSPISNREINRGGKPSSFISDWVVRTS